MTSLPPPTPPTPSGPSWGSQGPPPPAPPVTEYQAVDGGFRRLGGLSRAMLVLLGIGAALQVVLIPVMIAVRSKASDFLDGKITEETFKDAFGTQSSVQGLQAGVVISVAILTMIWMFRLAKNHRALGRPNTTWVPGWAIGGWFVPPGAVYVVPWLMIGELWKGADPANTPNDPNWKRRPANPLITVWWVLYGLVPLLGLLTLTSVNFGSFVAEEDYRQIADQIDKWFVVQIVLAAVSVVTAGVFAKIVYDLTRRQQVLTGER